MAQVIHKGNIQNNILQEEHDHDSGEGRPTKATSMFAYDTNGTKVAVKANPGGSLYNSVDNLLDVREAINIIESEYGDVVSAEAKKKALLKFGANPNVDTSWATIWYTGKDQAHETYAADNSNPVDSISSASASDTEIVSIEGHTMSAGNRTFVVQQATLNGQNAVTLTTPLNRVTRVRHAQQSSTNLVGEIYVYESTALTSGKPTDTTKIHLTVPAFSVTNSNNSQKASTSLSSTDYWIVTSYHSGLQEKAPNIIANVKLQWRPVGGVWIDAGDPAVLSSGMCHEISFHPYFIIPKNSDVRLIAISNTLDTEISGGVSGYLATITS